MLVESGARAISKDSTTWRSAYEPLCRRYLSLPRLRNRTEGELLVASASPSAPSAWVPIWLRGLLGRNRISILARNLWFFLGPIRGLGDASRMGFWFFGNVRGTGAHWLIQLSYFRLSRLGLFLVPGSSLSLLVCHNCRPCPARLRFVSDFLV